MKRAHATATLKGRHASTEAPPRPISERRRFLGRVASDDAFIWIVASISKYLILYKTETPCVPWPPSPFAAALRPPPSGPVYAQISQMPSPAVEDHIILKFYNFNENSEKCALGTQLIYGQRDYAPECDPAVGADARLSTQSGSRQLHANDVIGSRPLFTAGRGRGDVSRLTRASSPRRSAAARASAVLSTQTAISLDAESLNGLIRAARAGHTPAPPAQNLDIKRSPPSLDLLYRRRGS
ncbi:hypothetical protein EVAR_38152_1 [Eumeta japonica]|uniref:Uncharacterized protein n=1 Tax=Eumeta variegata TaxID=151549 RepID=A0A4C1ZGP1_EUMVA|nr:hypothetical protein EVAR_38152_1 [Eumeta japonica]